ncbi:beta-propeller fold lactonase family protein [Pseudomonas matsuisoli]|uniref:beta-propeller fold lactonase family protein n=1 Tax=Pseudomonas matsuisoli TaxID=1515666 RepID=UPI00166AD394
MLAYLDSRITRERNARPAGITALKIRKKAGALRQIQILGRLTSSVFLAMSHRGNFFLRACADERHGEAFQVAPRSAERLHLGSPCIEAPNPAYLAINPNGSFVVVSNHYAGCVAVLQAS